MPARDFTLTPRAENTREARPIIMPIQFSLSDIKQHFTESMGEVRAQFTIADESHANANETACKVIELFLMKILMSL